MTKNLFGEKLKARRPPYEASLERGDALTRADRAARIRWLRKLMPRGGTFMAPAETYVVFQDAKASFVNGQFISATVLATAFVDHWLQMALASQGRVKEAGGTLDQKIKASRKLGLIPDVLLVHIDQLRGIRNPYVHLKPMGHPDSVALRAHRSSRPLFALVEDDARVAMITMYATATSTFRQLRR